MEDEEAWDETLMGPREGDLGVLQTGDTSVNINPQLLRTQSSGTSAPPSSMFMQSVPSIPPPTTRQFSSDNISDSGSHRSSLRFEDEDDEDSYNGSTTNESHNEGDTNRIRQEALRMLEVADDQLTDSSYAVYRTSTGGFMATPKAAPEKRRAPSAMSGFSFATARKNLARPFRDDPYVDTESGVGTTTPAPSQEDYEYGEDNAIVDVTGVNHRSAASRPADQANNWSSRYSIDSTLVALSGGTVSSSRLLDKIDKENSDYSRRAASNLFPASPAETRAPQVFGSGFSFRQKHVFGQQPRSPIKEEPNLNTAFTGRGKEDEEEEAVVPARSWQEQHQQQRRNRRQLLTAGGVTAVVVLLIFIIMGSGRRHKSSAKSVEPPIVSDAPEDPSVTFYITSDVPLSSGREKSFQEDLKSISKVADFLAHLGDIQIAEDTGCPADRYRRVSSVLKTSPLPVFMVPGEEDWPNCPNQGAAWKNWLNNFSEFERNFNHNFEVQRYDDLKENYAFLHKGVLFIGVHETNGRIDNIAELNTRNDKNVKWVKASVKYHEDDMRAMVIFSNGRPKLRENDSFYLGLGEFLFANKIPTAYVHANHENGALLTYQPYEFDGMEHVIAIQSSQGENNAPVRINVGFDETNPFIVG